MFKNPSCAFNITFLFPLGVQYSFVRRVHIRRWKTTQLMRNVHRLRPNRHHLRRTILLPIRLEGLDANLGTV